MGSTASFSSPYPSYEETQKAKALQWFNNTSMPQEWKQMFWELGYREGRLPEAQYRKLRVPEHIQQMSSGELESRVTAAAKKNKRLLVREYNRAEEADFLSRAHRA